MAIDFTITKRVKIGNKTRPRPLSRIDYGHAHHGKGKHHSNTCSICRYSTVLKDDILCKKCKEQAV